VRAAKYPPHKQARALKPKTQAGLSRPSANAAVQAWDADRGPFRAESPDAAVRVGGSLYSQASGIGPAALSTYTRSHSDET
jgi:hypothetical protein